MKNRNLYILLVVVFICLITGLAVSTDRNHFYENDNWITTPPYQSDTTRAIDTYERIIEHYMDLMDEHFSQLTADNQSMVQQLTYVNSKLEDLSSRLSRIEKAMGIDSNTPSPSKTSKPVKH